MKKYDIYGLGNALVDMEAEVEDAFLAENGIEKGLMTLVDEERQHRLVERLAGRFHKQACGGSAANSVIGAAQFGARTFYSCKVAADAAGDFYLRDLKAAGVDTNLGEARPEGVSGKCLVMVTPDAERTMNTFLGITADFSRDELDFGAIAASTWLYAEGYLVTSGTGRDAAICALEHARKNGVKTALTFSDPAMTRYFREGLAEMVGEGVDLLFCNEQEAMLYTGTETLDEAIPLLGRIAETFAVTLGSKGALVFDGEKLHSIAPRPVKALDSNGAGDMFAGAFLYALTRGMDFPEAGRLAGLASAKVVGQFGPRLGPDEQLDLLSSFRSRFQPAAETSL